MSAYTITAGARRTERLTLTTLLDTYRPELVRLADVVAQQIAWLDANTDHALHELRYTIWETRWCELKELRATYQDRLVEAEIFVEGYLWIDLRNGLYDRHQAEQEVNAVRAHRDWWDASPIKQMQQFDHPDYGPCPF